MEQFKTTALTFPIGVVGSAAVTVCPVPPPPNDGAGGGSYEAVAIYFESDLFAIGAVQGNMLAWTHRGTATGQGGGGEAWPYNTWCPISNVAPVNYEHTTPVTPDPGISYGGSSTCAIRWRYTP